MSSLPPVKSRSLVCQIEDNKLTIKDRTKDRPEVKPKVLQPAAVDKDGIQKVQERNPIRFSYQPNRRPRKSILKRLKHTKPIQTQKFNWLTKVPKNWYKILKANVYAKFNPSMIKEIPVDSANSSLQSSEASIKPATISPIFAFKTAISNAIKLPRQPKIWDSTDTNHAGQTPPETPETESSINAELNSQTAYPPGMDVYDLNYLWYRSLNEEFQTLHNPVELDSQKRKKVSIHEAREISVEPLFYIWEDEMERIKVGDFHAVSGMGNNTTLQSKDPVVMYRYFRPVDKWVRRYKDTDLLKRDISSMGFAVLEQCCTVVSNR
ncbi:hypothetical protein BKA69DRAFT_446377 [Paraphysoderma sedebokerense]|nr:hypothetical protein BKA69DRAFT_446377 [Paraphysoderma sedebokerense]